MTEASTSTGMTRYVLQVCTRYDFKYRRYTVKYPRTHLKNIRLNTMAKRMRSQIKICLETFLRFSTSLLKLSMDVFKLNNSGVDQYCCEMNQKKRFTMK